MLIAWAAENVAPFAQLLHEDHDLQARHSQSHNGGDNVEAYPPDDGHMTRFRRDALRKETDVRNDEIPADFFARRNDFFEENIGNTECGLPNSRFGPVVNLNLLKEHMF